MKSHSYKEGEVWQRLERYHVKMACKKCSDGFVQFVCFDSTGHVHKCSLCKEYQMHDRIYPCEKIRMDGNVRLEGRGANHDLKLGEKPEH